jgi:hypothetical protein
MEKGLCVGDLAIYSNLQRARLTCTYSNHGRLACIAYCSIPTVLPIAFTAELSAVYHLKARVGNLFVCI